MIKLVTQNSYFEKKPNKSRWVEFFKNPSIVRVHPKSTHGCTLIWGNKYMARIIEVHHYIIDQMKILKLTTM
jgi:hypothetical protein